MPIFKYLHIITMFSAVGVSTGTEFLLHRIAHSGDVRAIKTAFGAGKLTVMLVPILFIIGMLFGLLTAWTGSWNFFAPWLIIAYVLFATMVVIGRKINVPWLQQVGKTAAMNQGDTPSAELQTLIHDKRAERGMYIGYVLIFLIVFVMVMKPFS